MTFQDFIQRIAPNPANLSLKGKLFAVLSCFSAILIAASVTQFFLAGIHNPILIASMGASAVILFIIPNSPLAQPWSFVGGQLSSAFVGIYCAQTIPDTALAASVATGGSVLLMLLLRCLHPPGAATALAPVMGGQAIVALGYSYVLMPVAMNVSVMLVIAVIVNRWLMGYDYPVFAKTKVEEPKQQSSNNAAPTIGISELDVLQALEKNDVFLDITAAELSKVLSYAESFNFKRLTGDITCADIMVKNVLAVEYGTEVEDAWEIMLKHHLKALPVIDRARRVIGMVTWYDFFKFIDLHPYQTLAERLRHFIQRTPDTAAHKPEAVGELMSTTAITCADSAHIVELIPLMAQLGHRQIPIVDSEKRLVGMVYQTNLIAALYHQQLAIKK